MKTRIIAFNKNGYDGFIDFIKAYAIICVLIGHSLLPVEKIGYGAWAGMQVPLFILIQVFHFFKKENPSLNFRKMFRRVMIPFFLILLFSFCVAWLSGRYSANYLVASVLRGGGYGPGSYYPWVYFQIALLLPLFAIIINRFGKVISVLIFLLLCEGFEILLSITDFPDRVYRLLAVRYVFLIYLGWIWAKEGIRLNMMSILFSVISLAAIIYFEYFSVNDEPFFYSTGWNFHRWPCYFYVAYGLTGLLHLIWSRLKLNVFCEKCIKILAKSSYEIFLAQMTVRFLVPLSTVSFISNKYMGFGLWLLIFWITSLGGGILLSHITHQRRISRC